MLIGGRLGEIPSQGYTLFDIPGPGRDSSMCIRAPRSSAGVYPPHLAIHAAPTAFAAAADGTAARAARVWRERTARRMPTISPGPTSRPRSPAASISATSWCGCARTCRGRDPLQRRRQLRGLDPPLLPLPPLRQPYRPDLGVDGLRRAGRGRHQAALSGSHVVSSTATATS